jgi:hypothetical protein
MAGDAIFDRSIGGRVRFASLRRVVGCAGVKQNRVDAASLKMRRRFRRVWRLGKDGFDDLDVVFFQRPYNIGGVLLRFSEMKLDIIRAGLARDVDDFIAVSSGNDTGLYAFGNKGDEFRRLYGGFGICGLDRSCN